jgi:protein gp37
MATTKIEWATDVWNPVTGCSKVSAGCKNCYAETIAKRFWGERKFTDVRCHDERLEDPLRWRKPRRVFVNSMSDLFHEDVPDEFICQVLAVALSAERHTFMILTKRARRMAEFYERWSKAIWVNAPNIWLGVSVENQEAADERIPLLLQTPAAVRFLSCEPLLGQVDLWNWLGYCDSCPLTAPDCPYFGKCINWSNGKEESPDIDWVICGGESGPNARPMHPDWARSLRDQCKAAEVPFFFKQWGEWSPSFEHATKITRVTDGCIEFPMTRVGKHAAGRLLDGREWNERPQP